MRDGELLRKSVDIVEVAVGLVLVLLVELLNIELLIVEPSMLLGRLGLSGRLDISNLRIRCGRLLVEGTASSSSGSSLFLGSSALGVVVGSLGLTDGSVPKTLRNGEKPVVDAKAVEAARNIFNNLLGNIKGKVQANRSIVNAEGGVELVTSTLTTKGELLSSGVSATPILEGEAPITQEAASSAPSA